MAKTLSNTENPLVGTLARLCGDITMAKNRDTAQVLALQQAVASALMGESALSTSGFFQFEQLENFTTRHLETKDLEHLDKVIKDVQETRKAADVNTRVFRREVPFISSQVSGSVPDWARGASISNTIGPVFNREGRRIWFDFYRIIPLVQVSLKGAPMPFLLLPLEVSKMLYQTGQKVYKIPKGSVWIQADKFAVATPDNLYCGLTVANGEINLSAPVNIDGSDKMVIPAGVTATIHLNLEQKVVNDNPDTYGLDVKEATISLPKSMTFTVSSLGAKFKEIGSANWKLYGQEVNFAFEANKPIQWNLFLNRILIPFKADAPKMIVRQCKSTVSPTTGTAAITDSFWGLNAAVIDISAPLEADGTGAMAVMVGEGLRMTWMGLKDVNLFEKSFASLKNALVMFMPGRINIATFFAYNPIGKQRYNLWKETSPEMPDPVQCIDLYYTKQFFLFYDCLLAGIESLVAQANCINNVNKPVQADGLPFKVESLQTVFALSVSKTFKNVMLYDDNIILDNWIKRFIPEKGKPVPPITFVSTAVALNNALLTVSPVTGMFLYGDLKTEDSFNKGLLVYSFGLLQYLPTLPDPYAANISFFRRREIVVAEGLRNLGKTNQLNTYELTDINALLVCLMNWNQMEEPEVNFFLGDKPSTPQPAIPPVEAINPLKKQGIRIASVLNPEVLQSIHRTNLENKQKILHNTWNASVGNPDMTAKMLNEDNNLYLKSEIQIKDNIRSPFLNAFTLLDVSTNADLLGVSLGFANDDFVFRKTHIVKEDVKGSPFSIRGMDVHAASRFVQIFTLPQISWEPVINISPVSNVATDPFPGVLMFMNDGVPAQIANTGIDPVSIAPIPLSQQVSDWYNDPNKKDFAVWSYFTLPYGMLALAMYYKDPADPSNKPGFDLIKKNFTNESATGLQITTTGLKDQINKNKKFFGSAHQYPNVYNLWFPATGARSILSGSVTEIFNDEFGTLTGFDPDKYVPLERYDFSGYGANVFSHWINENAALAQTSQAMFDVWRGRTAHEVVQVKSVIYPWAIRVVRTITIYRGSNGFEWRTDSGWKAESNGLYDFRTPIKDDPTIQSAINMEKDRAYKFHPGMVQGVYNVRNIKEDATLAPFAATWNKTSGVYIDDQGHPADVGGGQSLSVKLTPVYFDADVKIDEVVQGAVNQLVVSQRMLGYLQLRPRGVFIDQEDFANLLTMMHGLGGPVDCVVRIQKGKQQMRITRVEVNPGIDKNGDRVFVAAAKGTPVLPKEGSWSVVKHDKLTKEVLPLSNNDVVPLIREGKRDFVDGTIEIKQQQEKDYKVNNPVHVAEASELFKNLEDRLSQYGFLLSTGENKVLFRNPFFENGQDKLKGSIPDLADAYRLMNSKGVFPKLEDLPKLTAGFDMNIIEEGYKLINLANPANIMEQLLPPGPWYIVDNEYVKVYIEYKNGGADAKLNLDINSTPDAASWVNKMNDVVMVVDLGSFKRLLLIRGNFDTAKGSAPAFKSPVLEFGPDLKPVYDILVLLSSLSAGDYKAVLEQGLKIAMSNSPNNWEYKFQADKEIPVIKFPPPELDTAAAPLRLEAGLKAGVYFNVAIPLPPTNGIPMPSAGAYVEFYGKLSVMCVSVGLGSIYAVGQVTVRISADTAIGPALYMKFGFGVEAVVALPVIGSVSVYFATGVEMSLDSTQITIGAFILFRGRAEILGGIVTVTIQIEASGKVQDRFGGETNMIAQVNFSLDISICFIININFSESWEEQRQIS